MNIVSEILANSQRRFDLLLDAITFITLLVILTAGISALVLIFSASPVIPQ